ncbi:MAG: anthranilate synthase component I [Chloroflexota bacterium]
MYHPSLAVASELTAQGKRVPIYREILADMETPVSAFRKIARGNYSFLLESVVGGERLGRYSFLGTEPYRVLELDKGRARITAADGITTRSFSDPLEVIRQELEDAPTERLPGLPRFQGGAVGYLGYEVARYFERLPVPADNPLGLPEAMLMLADTLMVFDHVEHKIKVVSHVWPGGDAATAYAGAVGRIDGLVSRLASGRVRERYRNPHRPRQASVTSNTTRDAYLENVERAKHYIRSGDIIQVVPSQRLSRPLQSDPFNVYRALRTVNPSPYMYYLHLGDAHIVGASPEMLVRVEDGVVTSHPIAGTRRRGKTAEEDEALAVELRGDEKERAEHVMLVDLSRNDVGRVSAAGSVNTPRLMDVERYSHVMHLVSEVCGRLRPGLSQYDALRACFPAGTVTGAPKIRAMEIIAELEPHVRGPYAGAVGYFDYSGNLDTAITIRTIVVKDGIAYAQAGGGVVVDSDPEREYEETLNKAAALLKALDLAETI